MASRNHHRPRAKQDCDVLVVGGGPAGSFLAYLLSGRGHRVLLIDKASFPRDKVCGGGISRKTRDLLGRHGIDIARVVREEVTGCLLSYRGRDTVATELGCRGGASVLRSEFDHLLLSRAVAAGAAVHQGRGFTGVEQDGDRCAVATTSGPVEARYVLGADGACSRVRRAVFGEDPVRSVPAVEALLRPQPLDAGDFRSRALFDFGAVPRGYGWVFPKADHWNVGAYSPYGGRDIRRHLLDFIAGNESLRRCERLAVQGFPIPIDNRRRRFERGRVWLVGDAGGFADPFYGEGIFYALKTAEIAAAALDRRLAGGAVSYARAVRDSGLPTQQRYSRWIAALFYRHPRWGFYRMVRNPRMNDLLVDVVAGRAGHRETFFKTLALLPSAALPARAVVPAGSRTGG